MNTVRDGKKVWPTCPECGCRLGFIAVENSTFYFQHYNEGFLEGTDSRGCKCTRLKDFWEVPWDKAKHLLIGV